MMIDTTLNLSGPKAVLTTQRASLGFKTGDVEVFAQGGSSKDVANGVAKAFVADFEVSPYDEDATGATYLIYRTERIGLHRQPSGQRVH